jgi:hypothetical protein
MAMIAGEEFADKEKARIYIAGRVREAKRVEQVLSGAGIDYAVEMEPYQTRLLGILPVEYKGAVFYVLAGQADFCRHALRDAGLERGLVD